MPTWKSIPIVETVPLTTIFTPPNWCTTAPYTYHPLETSDGGASGGTSIFFRAQNPTDEKKFDERYSACYPPSLGQMNSMRLTSNDRGIYSPGVCPSGWTSHHITTSTNVYACCPDGFSHQDWQACKSVGHTPTIMAINESTNKTITPPYIIADWPLLIAWDSADLTSFTPASAPLPSVFRDATSGDSSSSSGGLSTGAKAGIGAGVGIAVIALIVLFVFLLIFRRKHRQRQIAEQDPGRFSYDGHYAKPPPGYEPPNSPLIESAAKYAPAAVVSPVSSGMQSPGGASELSAEKGPSSRIGSPRPTSMSTSQNSSELEVPTVTQGVTARELDSTQIHEAPSQHFAISNDQLGELGLAPIAARRPVPGSNVRRGPSSASTTSMYSEQPDNVGNGAGYSSIPGSTMAGRWEEGPSAYGHYPGT